MFRTNFFKRVVPFAITFSLGLFLASFFVPLSLPTFHGHAQRSARYYEMAAENERLRLVNEGYRRELNFHGITASDLEASDTPSAEIDELVPPPAMPSRARR